MDPALVQLITDLVMSELSSAGGAQAPQAASVEATVAACQGPTLSGPQILLCAVPAPRDILAPVWQSLKEVEGKRWLAVRGCPRVAPPEVPLEGLRWNDPPSLWDDLVASVEAVVLPALPLEVVSKLALLIPDTPATGAALAALMQGKPVLASSLEVDRVKRSSGRLPGGFQTAYFQHLRAVESLGVQILEPPQLAQRLQGKATRLATASRGRDVLTVEDLEAAARAGIRQLSLAPGTIVTPLARDMARGMGIEVEFA